MNSITILIVRLSSLGDILHGFPVAAALRREFPTSRIDWLVDRKFAGVIELTTSVDTVIYLERRRIVGATGPFDVVPRLRGTRYDWAIDIQGLIKSAVMARLSGAGRVVGFSRKHLKEKPSSLLYTEQHDPSPFTHVIEKNLGLLRAMGLRDASVEFCIKTPKKSASPGNGNFGIIHVGASRPNKRWPPDRMGNLAHSLLHRHGITPLIVHGPGESEIAEAVVRASGGIAKIVSASTLFDLLNYVSMARIFIGCDSGPLHLAAALGVPLVGIYGPTDPVRHGPWGETGSVVSRFSSCQCQYKRRCSAEQPCMRTITVDDVMNAVDRRLSQASTSLEREAVRPS